jgi:hypothetical protein
MVQEAPGLGNTFSVNDRVAGRLEEVAHLLEAQGANPFRVNAYRNAAGTLRRLHEPLDTLVERGGVTELVALPGVGESLARAIVQLARTDRLGLLERLRGGAGPEPLFATVPGIGRGLAGRIHDHLGIETLQDLEIAAYDGRLAQVPGMGTRRVQAVRESLSGRFRRGPARPETRPQPLGVDEPPVTELLDVDREYREKAAANRLPRIAPRRFNPTREAWLPILHTSRNHRHYTALFSNTARAHELGTTGDWVVIYRDDQKGDGRWTVITSRLGSLRGQRIVRGRESECRRRASGSSGAGSEDPDGLSAGVSSLHARTNGERWNV